MPLLEKDAREDIGLCQSARFSLGGICLQVDGFSPHKHRLGKEFVGFQSEARTFDIRLTMAWAQSLRDCEYPTVFASGGVWNLFRQGSDFVFDFTSPVVGPHPYRRLRVDGSFRNAELTLSREAFADRAWVYPLEYPADELLFTNYLAIHGLGVEVHGCGLIDRETGGHLLLGHSGAGKSTTARLWERFRQPEILSDDRIILRVHDGELWMYGTPWHGEAAFASAGKAKLNRILILQHGQQNELVPLTRAMAVGELFARCFPPFHSAVGLERTLEFLSRVVDAVPCHEFRFVPDETAVDAVLRLT